MSKIVVVMTCHNRREKTTGCLENFMMAITIMNIII